MKLIPLTRGQFAQVDDDTFEYLNQWKWCVGEIKSIWYAYRGVRHGKRVQRISMHRLIMNATERWDIVDHIDHNGLNNQKANLRIVTNSINLKNVNPEGLNEYGKSKKRIESKMKSKTEPAV